MNQQPGLIASGRSMSQDPRVGLSQDPFSQLVPTQAAVFARLNSQEYPPQYNQQQQAFTMIKGSQSIQPFILQQQQQNSQIIQNSLGFAPPARLVTRHMTVIPLTAQNSNQNNNSNYNTNQDNNNNNINNSNHQTLLNSTQNQQFIRSVSHHHLTTVPTSSRITPQVNSSQLSIYQSQKQQTGNSVEDNNYSRQNSNSLLTQSQLSQNQQMQQTQQPKIQQFPSSHQLPREDQIQPQQLQQPLQVAQQLYDQLKPNKLAYTSTKLTSEIIDPSRKTNSSTHGAAQNAIPASEPQLISIPQLSLQSSLITGYFPNSQESSRVVFSANQYALLDNSNHKQDKNDQKDNYAGIETSNFIGEAVYTPERTQSEKKSYTPIDQIFAINNKSDSQQLDAIQNDYSLGKQLEIFDTKPITFVQQTGLENILEELRITNLIPNPDIHKETKSSSLKASQIDGALNNNQYPTSYKPIPVYIPHYPSSQQIQIPQVSSPSTTPLVSNFSLELHKTNSNPISHQLIMLKPIVRADSFPVTTEKPDAGDEVSVNNNIVPSVIGTTTTTASIFPFTLSTQPALTNLFADHLSQQNGNSLISSVLQYSNQKEQQPIVGKQQNKTLLAEIEPAMNNYIGTIGRVTVGEGYAAQKDNQTIPLVVQEYTHVLADSGVNTQAGQMNMQLQPGITKEYSYSPLKPVILDSADSLRKSQMKVSHFQENQELMHSYSPAQKDKKEGFVDLGKLDYMKAMLIQENERIDKLFSSKKVIAVSAMEQDQVQEVSGYEQQGHDQEVQLVEEEQEIEPVLSQQAQQALRNQNGGWSPEVAAEEASESEEEEEAALGDVVQLQQLISQKTDQIRAQIESLKQSRRNQHGQLHTNKKGFQVGADRLGASKQDEGQLEEGYNQEYDEDDQDGAALTLADIETIIDEKMGQLVEKLKRKRSRRGRSVNDIETAEQCKLDDDRNSESSEEQQVINLYEQKRIEKNRMLFMKALGTHKGKKQSGQDIPAEEKGGNSVSGGSRLHHSKSQKELETIDTIHDNKIIQQLLHKNDELCGELCSADSNRTTEKQSQYLKLYQSELEERKKRNDHRLNNGEIQLNGKSSIGNQMHLQKKSEQKQVINLVVLSKGQHCNQTGQSSIPNANKVDNHISNSQHKTKDTKRSRKGSGYVRPFEESEEKTQQNYNSIRKQDQNSNDKQINHPTPTKSNLNAFSIDNHHNMYKKKSNTKDDKEKVVNLSRMKGMVVVEKKILSNNNDYQHQKQSSYETGKITNNSSTFARKTYHSRVNSAVFGNISSTHGVINRSSDIINLQSPPNQNPSTFRYLKKVSSKEQLRNTPSQKQILRRSSSREKYGDHQKNSSRGQEFVSRSFHSPGRQQARSSSREQISTDRKRELEESLYQTEKKRQEDSYVKDIQRQIEQQEKMLLSSKQASQTTWNSNSSLNLKQQSAKNMTKSTSKDSLCGFKTRGEYLYQIAIVQNQRQKELKKLRLEQQRKLQEIECTFSPSLVTSSASRNKSPGSFQDRQDQWSRERQLKKSKLQDSSSAENIRECTFRPELFSRINIAKDNIFVQQFHRSMQKLSDRKNIPASTNNSSQSPTLSRSSGFQLNSSQNHNKRSPQTVRSEKSRLLSQEENNYFTAINSKTSKLLVSTQQQFNRRELNSEESKNKIQVQSPKEFNVAKEISEYKLAVEKLRQQKANTLLSDLHFSQLS